MSTRQKSFFDQDPKAKRFRGQWTRPRNPPPHQHSDQARHVVTGPPIMPSSQTRTKLRAFQLDNTLPLDPDKENRPEAPTKAEGTPKTSKVVKDIEDAFETPRLPQSRSIPPPSTPGARLPLSDLVGNTDDTSRHAALAAISPEEQLYWRGSQPTATPVPRANKKRARSSSPAGPSQDESRLSTRKQGLTTPQADPATELWTRYTSRKTPTVNKKSVAFAHLINESSPRSAAAVGSVSGLRRWASCGVEFPASTRKRRRTHGIFQEEPDEEAEDVFAAAPSSDSVMQGQTSTTNLASIVQRMKQSISHSQDQPPSSSSPLPETGHDPAAFPDSPLKRHSPRYNADEETSDTMHAGNGLLEDDALPGDIGSPGADSPSQPVNEQLKSSASSDEFGEVDFDTDMADAVTAGTLGTDVSAASQGRARAPSEHAANAAAYTGPAESEDEFGLEDDDAVFAADLEQAASFFDTQPLDTPAQPVTTNAGASSASGVPVIDLINDDSDEFGDDIDPDEFAAAEIAATQIPATNTSGQDTRTIQRYLIKQVIEGFYHDDRGLQRPQKILSVDDEKTDIQKTIYLRQAWYDTPCTTTAYVHIIGSFSSDGRCVIDDHHNMLVLHPDHLISATVVADSYGCLRRAVLQDRIKATSRANAPMLYGTLLHELFQEALKANQWDTDFLLSTIDGLLPSKFETILEINSTCYEVKEHMSSKLPELQAWAKIFVRATPIADAVVQHRNGPHSIMSINKLLDVEEHVWSPMYGLKGNIDATVQVTMQDDQGERTLTVPFEVKTGKNSTNSAHSVQTALYNLLLSNRYDIDVAYGMLYYLETSAIIRIPAVRNEIIHMLIQRNELACYVRDRIDLPPMLKEDFKCGNCYAQDSCFLYDKLVEDGDGERLNKKAKQKYDVLVKSLKPTDRDFMKKWDALLTKEETDMMKFRRELWTMLSTEREKLGRCFSNVVIEPGSAYEEKMGQKINRYSYTFVKPQASPGFSFTESQLTVGEPVVVSDEQGHFALANGYVTNVRKRRITVAVDRRLHNSRTKLPGFDHQTNQTFAGIMEVSIEGKSKPKYETDDEPVLYRLDKDEFSNGMAAARNNLIQIMDDNVYKARDLRALIVEGRTPIFNAASNAADPPPPSQMSMNPDQRAAVAKVMSARDYALVLGMPGTGKTTTIAHIIRTLVAKGKSVLLTSYTHTAVDNILLKIRNDKIGILRLGASAKIHPEVREFASLAAEPKDSVEELERSWMDPPVVATTCLTINHPLFSRRVFDYCIVDEASQITLPVCLGPIRMSQKFVLVGDHYQLPPLVQNKEALEGGLDVSLFKLLCEAHPQAVVSLEHQYRMCNEVMLLSNSFIYSGRLKCGTPSIASRRLALPKPYGLKTQHRQGLLCPGPETPSCWLARSLSPDHPVVFINTDAISTSLEAQSGSRIINTLEARLITHLTVSLLSLGVDPSEIGIIAFYRSQLALLRNSLSSAHTQTQSSPRVACPAASSTVELHTADKFQGRDKEVVLVSCVRSNDFGTVGDLLKDSRRVNVALTRARSKLIILGSEKTLSGNELLRDMVGLCREKGWVLDLQSDMVEGHAFDEAISQTGKPTAGASPLRKATLTAAAGPGASPTRKRKVLGDITSSAQGVNARCMKKNKPEMKQPGKVFLAGKRGVLDNRPVLSNVFEEAL
ncbi:Tripartite DNA replication factor [Curvularia kusanoi]|uniref:DNA replication ATP-dependent helicase/nuclease n=1 Tax=Curvularia kusanoi TaxID=90978 RepID=A0A9P4TAV4_CURKU|nr:Tripartite DNA replication factor [Curvularia kusanoi]